MKKSVRVLAWLCHYSGASEVFFFLNRRRKRILAYHNVLPDELFKGTLHEGVSCRETVFEKQVRYISRRFNCSIDLLDRGAATLTFDDGNLNQYAVAHRILARLGVHALFFCTLEQRRSRSPLVVDQLLFWLSYVEPGVYTLAAHLVGIPLTLSISTETDRSRCWSNLYLLVLAKRLDEQVLAKAFDDCVPFSEVRRGVSEEACLLRFSPIPDDALAEMRKYGHEIGAHGLSHRILANLSDEELDREMALCTQEIGKLFNSKVFSYPFGGPAEVSPRVIEHAKASGFALGVSNVNMPLEKGSLRYSEMFLPRMSLPDSGEAYVLSFFLSGAKYFLQYRRLLPEW